MSSQTVDPELADKLNELYHVTSEIETKTALKNKLKDEVLILIKKHKMESRKFAIGDRYIKYKMDKQTGGLTQKLLMQALNEYHGPTKKDEALKQYKFILAKRETKMKEQLDIGKR